MQPWQLIWYLIWFIFVLLVTSLILLVLFLMHKSSIYLYHSYYLPVWPSSYIHLSFVGEYYYAVRLESDDPRPEASGTVTLMYVVFDAGSTYSIFFF